MFATDITLAGDASSSSTYSLTSIAGGNSERRDATAAADSPRALIIKHEKVTSKTGVGSTRHLVRLEKTLPQATTLIPVTASIHVVIDEPDNTITAAQLKDMRTQLINFLSDGNVNKLFNDEP